MHGWVISTLVDVAMAEAIDTTDAVEMEVVEAEVLQEEDGEVAALATGAIMGQGPGSSPSACPGWGKAPSCIMT